VPPPSIRRAAIGFWNVGILRPVSEHSTRSALVAVAGGMLLLVALWTLPDISPPDAVPVVGQLNDHARVVEALGPDVNGNPQYSVEVVASGERFAASVQDIAASEGSVGGNSYEAGDEVVVTRFTGAGADGEDMAIISDRWRIPTLATLALVFSAAVVIIGGLRGARSLVALALTIGVVVKLAIPLFLRGVDPVLLAVGGGGLVTVATLLLTEGRSRITLAAVLGTLAALVATAVLAGIFTAAADFTSLQGNEEIAFLIPLIGDRVDLQGILLAGTVFGALGVLDDVTVTQAATVEQLHRARPEATRGGVIRRAMHVGRSHIAAVVNTLVLAYLGASLPLLLLFALGGQDPVMVVNGEIVAVEVVRALIGSIGIVMAVPLTTVVAAAIIVRSPTPNAGT
jgi:uncharacterized membrane protein